MPSLRAGKLDVSSFLPPPIVLARFFLLTAFEVGRLMKEQMAKQSSFEVTPLQGLSFQDDGFQDSDDSGLDDIL